MLQIQWQPTDVDATDLEAIYRFSLDLIGKFADPLANFTSGFAEPVANVEAEL